MYGKRDRTSRAKIQTLEVELKLFNEFIHTNFRRPQENDQGARTMGRARLKGNQEAGPKSGANLDEGLETGDAEGDTLAAREGHDQTGRATLEDWQEDDQR